MQTKVLIVEDEFAIAMDIEDRLKDLGYQVVGIAVSYEKALPFLLEKEIDVILLDINLEAEKSGIDLGHLILDKFQIPIVFLTAYSDQETFDKASLAEPMGFINKPIKDSDLNYALQLAVKRYQSKPIREKTATVEQDLTKSHDAIFIKDKGQLNKVEIKDILWIEAMDNYTVVHIKDKRLVANSVLKNMIEILGDNFVRIHKSHAIALDKISSIDGNLVFINDVCVTVSKHYRSELMNRLKLV